MDNKKTMEEICTEIRDHVLENYLFGYDENELDNDSSFLELGVLDSTGIMELVAFIEKAFHIEVADHEILPDNFDSVNCISRYIYSKLYESTRS